MLAKGRGGGGGGGVEGGSCGGCCTWFDFIVALDMGRDQPT